MRMDITITKNNNKMNLLTYEEVNDWSNGAEKMIQDKLLEISELFSSWKKSISQIEVGFLPFEEFEECEYYVMPYVRKTRDLNTVFDGKTYRNRVVHKWLLYTQIEFSTENNRLINLALKKMGLDPLSKEQASLLNENGNLIMHNRENISFRVE